MRSADSDLVGFLATLLLHSTVWIAAAWVLARALRSAVWRARLWRGAALGGVASAALALAFDTSRLEWRWEPPAGSAPRTIAIDAPAVSLAADPASDAREPAAAMGATVPESPAGVDWSWTSLALGAWALGAVLALASLARDRRALARVLRARRPLRDHSWTADLSELTRRAGLRRAPRLSLTEGLCSPLAVARGEIVVPARALAGLARDEQRALLAHELAHLARRDPHWLLALALLERLFWFQPLLRAAGRRAGAAAELCCDEAAARWTGSALALARCLAAVASWVGTRTNERVAVAMAARGSALVERVERLLAPPRVGRFQGALCLSAGATLLAALACNGPTAREAEQADGEAVAEILRRRIDPEGREELSLEFVGGSRFEVRVPPERIAALRREAGQRVGLDVAHAVRAFAIAQGPDEAEIERVLARLDECPEAGIAFHVPFRDGRYATTVMVPEGHRIDLRDDGSIWCGDMLLSPGDGGDDRLPAFHLEELARCTREGGAGALLTGRLDVAVRDGTPFASLQRVLGLGGRTGTALAHYRLVRIDGARVVESLNYSLPTDSDLEQEEPRQELRIRVTAETDEHGSRSVSYSFSGRSGRSQVRSPDPSPSLLASRLASAAKAGTQAPVVIDAFPGTRYRDVRMLVEAVVQAGFTDIRFVGLREERR